MLPGQSSLTIYPVSNYSFGTKAPKFEKDTSVGQRMERLKEKYGKEGVRRSVDAVVVVYEHGHPHVLLFQLGTAFFKLPGGRLRPGEGDVEGLLRKLDTGMAPDAEHMKPDWRVGELLGTFYRPNFENVLYPYCPPHIARPKEIRRIYMVVLPEKCYFAVPKNYKLVAVPLFEIYDHAQRYGPIIAAIPQLLSRINIVKADAKATGAGGIVPPPVAAPAVEQQQQQGAGALTISLAPNGQNAAAPPPPVVESREEDLTIDFDM